MTDPIPWPQAPEWARVPDFTLPLLGGGERSLAGLLEDGPLWLAFMKSSCETCRLSVPYLERTHRFLKGSIGSVAVVLQEDPDGAREFADDLKLTLPILMDADPYAVSETYGVSTVPTFFLIEPDGSLSKYSAAFIREHLEEIAADLTRRASMNEFHLILDTDDAPVMRPG